MSIIDKNFEKMTLIQPKLVKTVEKEESNTNKEETLTNDVQSVEETEKTPQSRTSTEENYTKEELKNTYKLTDKDISTFFSQKNGEYKLYQGALDANFPGCNIKTVEDLLNAMEKIGFTEGYIRGAYSFNAEDTAKYFTTQGDGNNKRYILNQEVLKQEFPDQEIVTLGQLKEAISNKTNALDNTNNETSATQSTQNVASYGELRGRFGLSDMQIKMFFTATDDGGYKINQDAVNKFYGVEYQLTNIQKLREFINDYPLGDNTVGKERKEQVVEFFVDALKNGDSKYGFDKLEPKPTEKEIESFKWQLFHKAESCGVWGSLKDLEKLIESELGEIVANVQKQTFENQIGSEEYNKTVSKEEVLEYIDKYGEVLRAELKEKYNYSDEFIDSILQTSKEALGISTSNYTAEYLEQVLNTVKEIFKEREDHPILGNIDTQYVTLVNGETICIKKDSTMEVFNDLLREEFNLKETLEKFGTNVEHLLSSTNFYEEVVVNLGGDKGNLWGENLGMDASWFAGNIDKYSAGDNVQLKYFADLFKKTFDELKLDGDEQRTFTTLIFKEIYKAIGKELGESGEYKLTNSDLQKLSQNYDRCWFDELFEMVTDKFKELDIKHVGIEEIENATSIDTDIMFANGECYTAEYILDNINEMQLSDDAGVRKLALLLDNLYFKNKQETPGITSYISEEQLMTAFIQIINEQCGVENTNSPMLTKEAIEKLNTDGLFDKLNEIIEGNGVIKTAIVNNIDGKLGKFSQRGLNDCWFLAALASLNASTSGQNIIKNSINFDEDNNVIVSFTNGAVKITLDEIYDAIKAGDKYAEFDLDVVVLELAYEKQCRSLDGTPTFGDWATGILTLSPSKIFDGSKDVIKYFTSQITETYQDTASGLDDIYETVGGAVSKGLNWLTGIDLGIGGGKTDLSDDEVNKFLNKLYKLSQEEGKSYVAEFGVFTQGKETYNWTCVDGTTGTTGELDKTAHMFAITGITANTVTFVNPWDSSKSYTVTWEEFANIHVALVGYIGFEDVAETEEDEFYFTGKNYDMDAIKEMLGPSVFKSDNEYIALTQNKKNYKDAAESAILQLKVLIQNIKKNLTGFDSKFIDLACETLFNYYSAAINAATIRSGNGEVGTSFTYYDALRNTTVTSNDKSNMRSAWDHKDVNSGEDISKKTGQSATGVYIGHDKESGGGNDNDKFYIYLNIDEICAKLLQIMQGDLRQSLQ